MRTLLLFSLLLASFLLSCDQHENFPRPTTTTSGGSSSLPSTSNVIPLTTTDWRFVVGDVGNRTNPNNYQQTFRTSGEGTTSPIGSTGLVGLPAKATSFTLGMGTSTLNDSTSYCFWTNSFSPPATLRVGRSLTLKAKVRLDHIQGKGVSLALRGDRKSQTSVLFTTTDGQLPLTGTAGYTEYAVTLPYSASVDTLVLYFVLLPRTTGTVTFTNVSVAIN